MRRSPIKLIHFMYTQKLRYCSNSSSTAAFYDAVIVGGGLVGSAMACSIGKSARLSTKRILLLDSAKAPVKLEKNANEFSNRVSAVSPNSVNMFKKFGIWESIEAGAWPVSSLYVQDACTGTKITFEQPHPACPIAHIVENERIVRALHDCGRESCPNVEWCQKATFRELSIPENLGQPVEMTLRDGRAVQTSLLIAADGANSRVREMSGIGCEVKEYQQMAIVATLEITSTQSDHPNTTAWQRFTPNGPIALLPLNGTHSSLVWTTTTTEAQRLLELPAELFVDELNRALVEPVAQNQLVNGPLDAFAAVLNALPFLNPSPSRNFPLVQALPKDDRAGFPLSFVQAKDYIGHRVALIGDAAHRVHPLAGQGVNLGWSDVESLTRALEMAVAEGGDLGSLTYLKLYDDASQRRNVPVGTAIDALNHLFSNASAPSVLLRSAGFTLLDRMMPLKDQIVRIAS